MPGKFQKPLFKIRARYPEQYRRAFNPPDPLYEVDVRAKDADHALRNWKRGPRTEAPFLTEYSVTPYYGPEMTTDMARRLARKRAYEAARQRRNNRMYAYVGSSGSWRDADDEMFELAGDNYYDMAKDLLWQGDLSVLGPEDLEIANQQLEPFRDVRDDEAFGRMLGERLGDRERFLFGLRRGGVRAKPAYISPTALEELNDVPWRGDYDSYKWLKRNVGFEDPEGYPEDDF